MNDVHIEPSATVDPDAVIGAGTKVWHQAQVATGARVGADCVLGKGVYVGAGAVLGDRVKIQNGCGIFGATLEDDVLLAPGVYLLEDSTPRATRPDGVLQGPNDWEPRPVTVRRGASIGANATIAPGVVVGRYALVAIGSAVHRDVPDHALIAGNPARQVGWVCACAHRLDDTLTCSQCATGHVETDDGLRPDQPLLSPDTTLFGGDAECP